jgi:hypothetical protein
MTSLRPRAGPRAAAAVLLALSFGATPGFGQLSATQARLVGTVTDPSGAVVPGVDVTAVHKATSVVSRTATNERGDYLLDGLRPGVYDVGAEISGFKKQVFAAVNLQTGQYGRVDFVLETGAIAETVTVTGRSPVLDTEKAEMGSVVEERMIRDLPLRGRDLVKLAYLTTGGTQETVEIGGSTGVNLTGNAYGAGAAFNGLSGTSNQITLDGANNVSAISTRMAVSPTPETVQEFKLVTNNYSAEHGKVGGAVISMATKSGTNQFHGDAWFYLRDESMDANRFFNNRTGAGKLPVDYRILGGAFGGPISRNRTFFYGTYEHFADDLSITAFATVPSLARRAGDFSAPGLAGGPVAWTQLYDPYTVADGRRAAFAGNVIPASRINPFAARLMQLLPIPAPNVAGANVNNYSYPSTTSSRIEKVSVRVDHHLAGGSTLFGRFNRQDTPGTRHNGLIGAPGMLAGVYQFFENPGAGYNLAGGWVKPFGARLVSELNVSGWKSDWLLARALDQENWEERLGFDTASLYPVRNADGSRGPGGMPWVNLTNYMGWSGAAEQPLGDWGVEARYSLAWRKGDHFWKVGLGHIRDRDVHYLSIPQGVGLSMFDGYATGQVARDAAGNITGAAQGDPFADFLLGAPSRFAGNLLGGFGLGYLGGQGSFNQSHYSAFVQDEWKASRNVSLSLGMRWEQARPPHYNGTSSGSYASGYYYCAIDLGAGRWNPTQWFPRSFDITKWAGGDLSKTAIPYKNLPTEGCYRPRWSYFQPRLGLAWKLFGTNRTVLRVGAGSSIDTQFGVLRARILATNIGEANVLQTRGAAPAISFGKFKDLPQLATSAEYRSCYFYEMDWQEGRIYSYNLSIQHELFRGTMVEVGYVGNQARHLRNTKTVNIPFPEGYDRVRLHDGTPQPISGAAVTLPGSSSVFTGQRARRPYPQLVPSILVVPDGSMHYDSFQAKVERRFAAGWALSSGYTWSKAMALNFSGNWFDNTNGGRYYDQRQLSGPMAYDRPHTFYSSFIWELPFFENSKGPVRALLGGWEIANVSTLTSGQTFPVNVGFDILDLGFRGMQATWPDRVRDGALPKGERTVDRFFDTSAFACANAGCKTFVPLAQTSNFGLGNTFARPLRGAALPLTDFSLHKRFRIRDRQTFDFRVDLFNALNHPIFHPPNGSVASGNGGKVTDTASPRQVMIGLRYSF